MLNIVDISETINNVQLIIFVAVELGVLKNVYVCGFMFTLCVFAYCFVI